MLSVEPGLVGAPKPFSPDMPVRYRKNPIPALGNIRDQQPDKSDTEISRRENKERNDDDDQSKLNATTGEHA